MQKLIHGSKKADRAANRVVRKRVIFVLCALFLAFAMSLSVSAIRKPIFRFFKTVYQNSIGFYAQETSATRTILEYYTIGEVPAGYEAVEPVNYGNMSASEWRKDNLYISLEQATLQSTNLSVSTKDENGKAAFLRGTEIFYITSKGTHTFIWLEDGYSFTFICPDAIPWDDIVRMIESIRPAGLSDGNT